MTDKALTPWAPIPSCSALLENKYSEMRFPCNIRAVVVKYRQHEGQRWAYRCQEHAEWLDKSKVIVESIEQETSK